MIPYLVVFEESNVTRQIREALGTQIEPLPVVDPGAGVRAFLEENTPKPPALPPLVNRCRCRRVISENKNLCRACADNFAAATLAAVAPKEETDGEAERR